MILNPFERGSNGLKYFTYVMFVDPRLRVNDLKVKFRNPESDSFFLQNKKIITKNSILESKCDGFLLFVRLVQTYFCIKDMLQDCV